MDEAIAEVRKLQDVQLAELKAVWKEDDPTFAGCLEYGGLVEDGVADS